ncbi:MAG: SpoIID/LytB domain-containing protein [Actinobacteria bacterium]|nr:SpoIID/LytB domain-containing protein [Actinomycetota bacterium]
MRDLLVLVLGVLTLVGTALPAGAQEASTAPVDVGVYGGSVRFEAGPDGVLDVDGERRYADTIELRVNGSELVFINELSIEGYLEGLAEVPARWPEEALKAQAVAARTYAWNSIELGTFGRRGLGYDICATVACQVFHGRDVVEGPFGERWAAAVAETAGEVLLYEGEPILTRYSSSSGGRTQSNEEVFPREGPRPYLKGVDDPYDEVSPFHRWTVRFTRDEFDALLARGESLSTAVPVADASVRAVDGGEDQLVVVGRDGTRVEVGVSAFRFFASDVAPSIDAERFPGPRADGGRLPATLPSSRFDIEVGETEVVLEGRGFGHGVGMSQYGALGQAEAGIPYDDILASYYQGLRPTTSPDLPGRVRVGLENDVDEPLTVTGDAPFRIVASGEVVTERALGTWQLVPRADGSVQLLGPPGYGTPLVVATTTASRLRPTAVEVVTLETVVSKTSELVLEVAAVDGRRVRTRSLGVVAPGRQVATWDLDDDDGVAVPPGEYRARLVATDEESSSAGEAVTIDVAPLEPTGPAPSLLAPLPGGPGAGGPTPYAVAALLGLAVGAFAGAVVRVRR